jgi:tRNA modification GTPase
MKVHNLIYHKLLVFGIEEMMGDTISAISTPPGEGGIGIVRLSGPSAIKIADMIFYSPRGIKPSLGQSHRLYYGFIIDPETGEKIDEVLLAVMRAPYTYTREDVVEINCHGGYIVLKRVLEITLRYGARLAMPGEFTMRAFLNGRIDLTQAEAVIDLIKAKTEEAERLAIEHASGSLRRVVEDISGGLQDLLVEVEAYIDFPEEDIFHSPLNLTERIKEFHERLRELSRSFYQGRVLREGLTTVIAGRPNVGKSSLLNALLGTDRAIVTDIPGTTRDIIEEVINVKGIPLRLIDTAGIREAKDIVEAEGIRRTEAAIERAEMTLFVIDGSQSITFYDISILERLKEKKKRTIVVINKKDLGLVIKKEHEIFKGLPAIEISVLKGEGINELKELIFSVATEDMANLTASGVNGVSNSWRGLEAPYGSIITRQRHKVLIDEALQAMEELYSLLNPHAMNINGEVIVTEGSSTSVPTELIAFFLRKALNSLNQIIGIEFSEEDLLQRIFSEFCIGK